MKKKNVKQQDLELIEMDTEFGQDKIESIYPFTIIEEQDRMLCGKNHVRVIAFAVYPDEAKGDWLADLKRLKGNIAITQHIEAANSEIMDEYYNNIIKNKMAQLDNTYDPKKRIEYEKQIKSAKRELSNSYEKKSGYVYLYTYVTIQADTLEELNKLEEKVMITLRKIHVKGLVPYRRMKDAYISALPLEENLLKDYTMQMANTKSAASFFLFDDNEICNLAPRATMEGKNKTTGGVVAIDYNNSQKTLNRNKVIFGTSGVGKTTYICHLISDMIARGEYTYILDPEDEYSFIVNMYGGTVIHYSVSSDTKINPLEFFSLELADLDVSFNIDTENQQAFLSKLIYQKVQRLKGFWKIIKEDMSNVEQSIVDTLLIECYQPLYNLDIKKLEHTDFPTLADLFHKIDSLKNTNMEKFDIIKDFYYILDSYVNGSNSFFNGHTNVDLKNKLVSFDLSALQDQKDIQGACYYNLFGFLWDEIINQYKIARQKGIQEYASNLIADEFHFLLKNPESCDFFFQAYKRFRKYLSGCIVATQQINDVLDAKYENNIGKAITENSYTKVFFGMDPKGVEDVIKKMDMKFSQKEVAMLKNKTQGEALIVYGNKRVFMEVSLPQEEMRLFNKKKYKEIYGEDPEVQPDYKSQLVISPVEREEIRIMMGGR